MFTRQPFYMTSEQGLDCSHEKGAVEQYKLSPFKRITCSNPENLSMVSFSLARKLLTSSQCNGIGMIA